MKRITALLALLPATAFAHGAHAPVPDAGLHGLAHALPAVAVVALVAAVLVAWRARQ